MTTSEQRLLTEVDAAAELGISVAQLRALAREHRAPEHFHITVTTIRYLHSAVQAHPQERPPAMSTDSIGTPEAQRPDLDAPASTISRDTAAAIAQRAGAAAVMYYPEIHADDLTFALGDEITWCLEGVDGLDAEDERILRDVIARTIIDPTAHRSKLNEVLDILTDDPKA